MTSLSANWLAIASLLGLPAENSPTHQKALREVNPTLALLFLLRTLHYNYSTSHGQYSPNRCYQRWITVGSIMIDDNLTVERRLLIFYVIPSVPISFDSQFNFFIFDFHS